MKDKVMLVLVLGVLLGLLLLVLVIGLTESFDENAAMTGSDVVLAADPADHPIYPAAILTGKLTLRDGCLALNDSPTLWPAGSVWDEAEETVVLADGSRLAVGDRVELGGGLVPASVVSNYSTSAQGPIDACMRSLDADKVALIGGTAS